MVNADRVKQKLPGLLVNAKTTKRKAWNEFMRKRYPLRRLRKSNPKKHDSLMNELLCVLEKIEKTQLIKARNSTSS